MKNPRQVDQDLVEAYLATPRALDYLVGFNLSPVLWRKPAGRALRRSRAIRLACASSSNGRWRSRPSRAQEYWSRPRHAPDPPAAQSFEARLVSLAGRKIERLSLEDATRAEMAVRRRSGPPRDPHRGLGERPSPPAAIPRRPSMTLQRFAAARHNLPQVLPWARTRCMSPPQRLYEAGLITLHADRRHRKWPPRPSTPPGGRHNRPPLRQGVAPTPPGCNKTRPKERAARRNECIRPTDTNTPSRRPAHRRQRPSRPTSTR